jgi:hypothetical protein
MFLNYPTYTELTKCNVQLTLEEATTAQRVSRVIALPFLYPRR